MKEPPSQCKWSFLANNTFEVERLSCQLLHWDVFSSRKNLTPGSKYLVFRQSQQRSFGPPGRRYDGNTRDICSVTQGHKYTKSVFIFYVPEFVTLNSSITLTMTGPICLANNSYCERKKEGKVTVGRVDRGNTIAVHDTLPSSANKSVHVWYRDKSMMRRFNTVIVESSFSPNSTFSQH